MGLIIGIVAVLGVVLGISITVILMKSGDDAAKSDRPETKATGTRTSPTSSVVQPTPSPALTELPGVEWHECDNYIYEICGTWRNPSGKEWQGQWEGVQSNLAITIDGKVVTVIRRDTTATTEAKYRGTLNTDNTAITGTVDWCCDTLGNRSGTWHAELTKSR